MKHLRKILLLIIVVALLYSNNFGFLVNASSLVNETIGIEDNDAENESYEAVLKENLESLVNEEIREETSGLIIVEEIAEEGEIDGVANIENDGLDNHIDLMNDTEIVSTLPVLNDGLMASLDTDTEAFDEFEESVESYANSNNIVSNGNLSIAATSLMINKIIMAENDINIHAGTINSAELVILYSRKGDITIESDDIKFNGLIYAPNGKVTLAGNVGVVEGMILGKETDVQVHEFEILFDENVNERYNLLTAIQLDLNRRYF
ncbi:hypothetical protein LQZ18_03220 [Lachnospiraceae bacterium ZAX-1]